MSKARTRLPFKDFGTAPLASRKASPSAMAVLPTPASPIITGLFFLRRVNVCVSSPNLRIPPDNGIQLSAFCQPGQVYAVPLQGPVSALRTRVINTMRAPRTALSALIELLLIYAEFLYHPSRIALRLSDRCNEEVLHTDEVVPQDVVTPPAPCPTDAEFGGWCKSERMGWLAWARLPIIAQDGP